MSFQQLIVILKGSAYSGNYGHDGRPGKVGGSALGGGHERIGVRRGENALTIKRRAYTRRTADEFPELSLESKQLHDVIKAQGLAQNCGKLYDCSYLRGYTGSGFIDVNKFLRGVGSVADPKTTQNVIKGIDQAFDAVPPLDRPIKVYRGLDKTAFEKLNLYPGDEFRDDGFTSTALTKYDAFSGVKMEIRVPAGARAIYVDPISINRGEHELIIDRSSKYRVLEVERTTSPGGFDVVKSVILEMVVD